MCQSSHTMQSDNQPIYFCSQTIFILQDAGEDLLFIGQVQAGGGENLNVFHQVPEEEEKKNVSASNHTQHIKLQSRQHTRPRNRRFPEITGEDNLIVFSYSGRVKPPEWGWQRRRAYLRHFEIFRHEPIIIYTRLPAGGTYYPICTFPASRECLIGIFDAFSAFCLQVSVIFPTCSL